MVLQRAILLVLGVPVALFALWGAWEIARQTPHAPQAVLGAAFFAAAGVLALIATILGARAQRR